MIHKAVLLQEVVAGLAPKVGEVYLDGTLGAAGHAAEIGARLGSSGILIGLDQDSRAIREAKETLAHLSCRVMLRQANFRGLDRVLEGLGIGKIDLVLLDLGFSSDQIESSGRGFSFLRDEPLLMTLSYPPKPDDLTAEVVVNEWSEESLADIIYGFGDERFSRRIAKAIIEAREIGAIKTSGQLAEIISQAVPGWYRHGRIHPATRTFQALRIAVNDELGALTEGLEKAWSALGLGGRLGVISFHSLEARLVKDFFNKKVKEGKGSLVSKKAIKPSRIEEQTNPRSRSAQLRIIIKN